MQVSAEFMIKIDSIGTVCEECMHVYMNWYLLKSMAQLLDWFVRNIQKKKKTEYCAEIMIDMHFHLKLI